MKIKTIKLRKISFTKGNLKKHLNLFFKDTGKNTQYVFIQVMIFYNNTNNLLFKYMVLDLHSKKELKRISKVVLQNFANLANNKGELNVDTLKIKSLETNKKGYNIYIKSLSTSEILDIFKKK